MTEKELKKLQEKIQSNSDFRKTLAKNSFYWFFHIYFTKFLKVQTADFQREWCELLTKGDFKFLEIIGFRGSAKSTYLINAYPIWVAITEQSHYTLLLSDTSEQIKEHFYNIKHELENNELLKKDFGPFKGQQEWTKKDVILPKYNAKIAGKSTGNKVRGLRFREYRPQLVIGDDLESLDMVRTKARRDKSYRWYKGDVLNIGEDNPDEIGTKYILIGNLLHPDDLMSRIKKEIEEGTLTGIVKEYPLINEEGEIAWKGKYPDMKAIEAKKKEVGSHIDWSREYLLKIVADEDRIIKNQDIQRYDESLLYTDNPKFRIEARRAALAVDLAISEKQGADYTAMVGGLLTKENKQDIIYIYPLVINTRADLYKTKNIIEEYYKTLPSGADVVIEDVAYQKSAIKEVRRTTNLPVEGIRPIKSKRARLETISIYIKQGRVRFPNKGADELIDQLIGFGMEKHDDMVDALVYLILYLMDSKKVSAGFGRGDAL